MSRAPRRIAAALVVAFALSSCSDGPSDYGTAGKQVQQLTTPSLPPEMLGLTVKQESVLKRVQEVSLTYVNAAALYSLRDEEQVKATLQINRFDESAAVDDEKFRLQYLGQVSGNSATPFHIAGRTVYQAQAATQRLAVWFVGSTVFVLNTRADYDHPRDLLRAALELST